MKYCLIGGKLGHSFSKVIHQSCGLDYDLVELAEAQLEAFVRSGDYDGYNVTIPYKKAILPYLDEIDEGARLAGAVNTVVAKNGKLYGYNTDVLGFEQMVKSSGITLSKRRVLVLGSGGASGAVQAVCKAQGASSVVVVSRTGEVNYDNVYATCADAEVIINSTPVGMYPDDGCPIDVDRFDGLVAVFDCVYNPIRTKLVLNARSKGLVACGGLKMLLGQAFEAQKIWGVYDGVKAENTAKNLVNHKNNLVLSGMPGCGKSTIGRLAAEALGLDYVDTDDEILRRTTKTAQEIILSDGEAAFRDIESAVVYDLSRTAGKVIALGGGAVLRPENVRAVEANGIIVYIQRDVSLLATENRPLSQAQGVQALFDGRRAVYESTADGMVINDGDIADVAQEVIDLYENLSYQRS